MLYAMFATDIQNGVQLRESLREQRVAFLQGAGDNVRAAGRTLDTTTTVTPTGVSLFISPTAWPKWRHSRKAIPSL